jgi:large subunit ribosomal protein L9
VKVLLRQDVKNIGKKGEIAEVKEGYARNFLLPNGLAVEANTGTVRQVEEEKKALERRRAREREQAGEEAKKLAAVTLVLKHKAGEEGHLFGSVTSSEIAEGLKAMGFDVDKKKIHLDEPIRFTGRYSVPFKPHHDLSVMLAIVVEKQG